VAPLAFSRTRGENRHELIAVLTLTLLFLSAAEIVVAEPLPLAFPCVQAALNARGEPTFRVERAQGVITTGFRLVETDTLRRIAATDRGGGRLRWTYGLYQLSLRLSTVDQARTRVRVSARILGAGETAFPLLRPSAWWPLPSTGRLEGDVRAALARHCRTHP
jgi:hypothetical protein